MEIYLVGGAVRDRLLGLSVKDRDWVVVGSDPAAMQNAGYLPVGRDFPVFLHPRTREEYALARTERKSGRGHHGFEFHASPDITLEEDLGRRDLTINAIAEASDGRLIDPYNGQQDLQSRQLRHVSAAFVEDPLRVLRVARFHARLATLGFTIAAETLALMKDIAGSGELQTLPAERVWQEIERALSSSHPEVFFESLRACDALEIVLPELNALHGIPQPEKWHPEIDTGLHTMMALREICSLTTDTATRFATLCHDVGKSETPTREWPSHKGHEERGARLVTSICARLRAPRKHRELAVLTARFHTHAHRAFELRPATLHNLLQKTDAGRRADRFEQFLLACLADARGRLGKQAEPYPQAMLLRQAAAAWRGIDAAALARELGNGAEIAQQLEQARIKVLSDFLATQRN